MLILRSYIVQMMNAMQGYVFFMSSHILSDRMDMIIRVCISTHWPLEDFNKISISNCQLVSAVDGWGIAGESPPLDLTDDKSTLVLVTVWRRQAIFLYMSQCWHKPMLANGVIRQWVKFVQRLKLISCKLCVEVCTAVKLLIFRQKWCTFH